ncbi:short-chain dehydrogenase/reductase [Apodospora peruviana]|uniref:Short-chain dehydrogenase/reductase n=1 Tax=Apodospora peruviana TaxID=516989 RepID=A0AAE0M0P5_9PEZI|nr:short-chain dehydrogenase/reductase [Apodospora peruviana]
MATPSVFKSGNTAVITGGASGIGLSLANKCMAAGMKVLVADWDDELLGQIDASMISTFKMDVGKHDEWEGLKSKVENEFGGKINLLALNAGVSRPTSFLDPSPTNLTDFNNILSTNLFGVINGIHTLLPLIIKSKLSQSAIIITGSKQGITNPPGNPAYNASKAAIKSLAEHLDYDLRSSPNITVHLLIPGWTFTGLSGNRPGTEKEKPAGAWWPDQVVDYLSQKMAENKFYIVCPDNDVTTEIDNKRMLWATGDIVVGRPPLTRWRPEFKDDVQSWMDQDL